MYTHNTSNCSVARRPVRDARPATTAVKVYRTLAAVFSGSFAVDAPTERGALARTHARPVATTNHIHGTACCSACASLVRFIIAHIREARENALHQMCSEQLDSRAIYMNIYEYFTASNRRELQQRARWTHRRMTNDSVACVFYPRCAAEATRRLALCAILFTLCAHSKRARDASSAAAAGSVGASARDDDCISCALLFILSTHEMPTHTHGMHLLLSAMRHNRPR